MLRLLLLLFLAPLSILTHPTSSSSTDQSVFQLPNIPVIENAALPPSSSAVRLVYQSDDQRLENLAVRSNGQVVLMVVNKPLVLLLDPSKKNQPPKLVHQFPGVTSMTGIAEMSPDLFAVVAGNWSSATLTATPGSFSIWTIDLKTRHPTVKLITAIPQAAALNGATRLNESPDIMLVTDSVLGGVWRVNVATGAYSMAIQSCLMGNTSTNPMGINSIRTFGGSLYFFNSAEGSYGRVPITDVDGSATGEVEILARISRPSLYDDFDMDWEGNAWVATHGNALTEITTAGKQRNVTGDAGKNNEMLQPTSTKFGRGSKQEEKTLYVTTVGNGKVGGQVIAVNTCLI